MLRPESKRYRTVGYHGYVWGRLKNGSLSDKKRSKWTKEGKSIYYRCIECGKINRLLKGRGDMLLIEGGDLHTVACLVCNDCFVHTWYTFVDAVPEKIQKRLKDPEKCPLCRKDVAWLEHEDDMFDDPDSEILPIRSCCGLTWICPKSSARSLED